MKIAELGPTDIGRQVVYGDPFGVRGEYGRLKTWNEHYVFVVFKCDGNWDRYQDYTAQSCDPRDVRFTKGG
jgi:hypothetical protein